MAMGESERRRGGLEEGNDAADSTSLRRFLGLTEWKAKVWLRKPS